MLALLDTGVRAVNTFYFFLTNIVMQLCKDSSYVYISWLALTLGNRREIGLNLDTVKCNKITQSLSSGLDQMYAFCATIGEFSRGDVERTVFGKGSWE